MGRSDERCHALDDLVPAQDVVVAKIWTNGELQREIRNDIQ